MQVTSIIRVVIPIFLLFNSGCGGSPSSRSQNNIPPAPTTSDAWFGTAGNVLVSDRTSDKDGAIDFLWIGFNSPVEWQKLLANEKLAISGTVISPSANPLNFHLDPNTTATVEAGIPELFTVIDILKTDPTRTNPVNHTHTWFISQTVEQIR